MKYLCQYCKHEFSQKNDLRRHLEKKNGCVPLNKIEEIKKQAVNNNEKGTGLQSLFKSCLDILRNDKGHLIGDEALHEMSYFLILKLVEPQIINKNIDIYNLEYYVEVDEEATDDKENSVKKFNEKLEYVKFSKFVEYVNAPTRGVDALIFYNTFIWGAVLAYHPKFKDVFEIGQKSAIKNPETIKKLVNKLNEVDLAHSSFDVLGEAYEKIFVDTVFGAGGNKKAELGQFFTPHKVKQLLIKLIDPKIDENGRIESVMDPACGTGGILINVIKHYKTIIDNKKFKNLSEQLKKNIYGTEIKNKIFNLCMSNMLINTGEILPNVYCGDSIRVYKNIKVDCICANPPFSVTIKYEELEDVMKPEQLNEYIPIKVGGKNSEVLFLQLMIHCLKIGGRCATVMLDGEKMYGSSSGYGKVREYLMRSCDLQEVIMCPAGTFTSTASKTCILYFVKKYERRDVLKIEKKKSVFLKKCATKVVKFYDFNPDTEEKIFVKEATIEEIAKNNYALNYTMYGKKEEEHIEIENVEYVKLGDICDINYGERVVKNNVTSGEYYVYGGGDRTFTINKYNRDGYNIVIGRFAISKKCVRILNDKFYLNDSGLTLSTSDDDIILKYVGYYMLHYQFIIYGMARGTAQKNLNIDQLKILEIPKPPKEFQEKIVKFLDELFKDIEINDTVEYYKDHNIFQYLLKNEFDTFKNLVNWGNQEKKLKEQIEFYKKKQQMYITLSTQNEEKKCLKEICDDTCMGKYNSKDCKTIGKYPFYNSVANSPVGFYDDYCFDCKKQYLLLIKDGGSGKGKYGDNIGLGKVFLVNGKNAGTTSVIALMIKNTCDTKYLYYYLKSIKNTMCDMANYTIGLGHIRKSEIDTMNIPIPLLENQQKIVKFCEDNEKIIKSIQNEINENKNFIDNLSTQNDITENVLENFNIESEREEIKRISEENIKITKKYEVIKGVGKVIKI